MSKAIALYSGGLDSTLAILTALKQGIEVKAVKFLTPFNENIKSRYFSLEKGDYDRNLNIELFTLPIDEQFIELIQRPKYGFGKNMNPCIDCKILMLKEAKKIMDNEGYDFIITGEVLQQRPMSQRRDILSLIDKEASVKGYVVRPLSAKLLKPTIPEESGKIDREKLFDFSGRSRKPQLKLAKDFGLKEYAQPAGGCLLTDPLYSQKLKDLLNFSPNGLSINDIKLLQVGRHFRVKDCKIIVGRDRIDNHIIESLALPEDMILWVKDYNSPLTLIRCLSITEEVLQVAASLCIRYSAAKKLSSATVVFKRKGSEGGYQQLTSKPLSDDLVNLYRVVKE
ncbi:MAG: hypothetical protein N2511_06015 [Thermodesulfovibrionales bacterium]|nr:hypothetical protein [Thermodesulfovibrionales bacterium]